MLDWFFTLRVSARANLKNTYSFEKNAFQEMELIELSGYTLEAFHSKNI